MWGIIPAAGRGSRIQRLAFSKELLPVGSRSEGTRKRPVTVSEYLVERLLIAGVSKLCVVIAPGKSDIVEYYGSGIGSVPIAYVVQDEPKGLCDAIFRAAPFIADDEWALLGLPDTIWFPEDGFLALEHASADLSFLLFPVDHPELFDAVVADETGLVSEIQVKNPAAQTHWVWGGIRMRGHVLRRLHEIWSEPERHDEYIGTLANEYIRRGGTARAVRQGRAYVDVGTVDGYREATRLLEAVKLLENVRSIETNHGDSPHLPSLTTLQTARQITDSGER